MSKSQSPIQDLNTIWCDEIVRRHKKLPMYESRLIRAVGTYAALDRVPSLSSLPAGVQRLSTQLFYSS
jgi:hypothetical protein